MRFVYILVTSSMVTYICKNCVTCIISIFPAQFKSSEIRKDSVPMPVAHGGLGSARVKGALKLGSHGFSIRI